MVSKHPLSDLTFLGGKNRLARFLGRPIHNFLAIEAAGGLLMLVAAVAALIWVNSPAGDSYHDFWATKISFTVGDYVWEEKLYKVVQDALMTLFFFVVGLEIKREIVSGSLRDPRFAALPTIAAIGGMVLPAALFVALNPGGDEFDGWGIPMATDIAFAVGLLSLLGNRISRQMKVFLLTLAIVDDIGAILVIAIFYTDNLSAEWLELAGVLLAAIWIMRILRVWYLPIYLVAGGALWLAVFESGVHGTIAGVILGLMTPAKAIQSDDDARKWADWLSKNEDVRLEDVQMVSFHLRESQPVSLRIEDVLHPIASYVIIPLFALSAAGVELSSDAISNAVSSSVTLGIVLGLVVGKTVGISVFAWVAHRLKLVAMPPSMTGLHLVGLAMIAGVGFTVSLFISGLAYEGLALEDESKIGILVGSLIAAVGGMALLSSTTKRHQYANEREE